LPTLRNSPISREVAGQSPGDIERYDVVLKIDRQNPSALAEATIGDARG
jgi:hypothetical protein